MLRKIVLSVMVVMLTAQFSYASVANDLRPALNKALRFEDLSLTLLNGFRKSFGDSGYIGTKEIYFTRSFGRISSHDLDGFTIHILESGSTRHSPTVQINVAVQDGASEKADKLKLVIEKALKIAKWSAVTTVPYTNGSRRLVGVGPEHISTREGAQNIKIAKFLEAMSALAKRLETEELHSVLSR